MRNGIVSGICAIALLTSCNIEKKKDGALPDLDIDVQADAGAIPEYDVDWAEVNVGTTTKTVTVPKVVVVMEEEEVEVPFIDVDMPNAGEKEERTLLIEAEVTNNAHKIQIQQIWATGKKIMIISQLTAMDQKLGDKKMRVSDQVTLNAPDLDVKYYVLGEKPDRVFNTQHKYFENIDALKSMVPKHKVIYKR